MSEISRDYYWSRRQRWGKCEELNLSLQRSVPMLPPIRACEALFQSVLNKLAITVGADLQAPRAHRRIQLEDASRTNRGTPPDARRQQSRRRRPSSREAASGGEKEGTVAERVQGLQAHSAACRWSRRPCNAVCFHAKAYYFTLEWVSHTAAYRRFRRSGWRTCRCQSPRRGALRREQRSDRLDS